MYGSVSKKYAQGITICGVFHGSYKSGHKNTGTYWQGFCNSDRDVGWYAVCNLILS